MLNIPSTQVAAGTHHSCALTIDGGVKCWGYNGDGELGDGTTDNSFAPMDVAGLTSDVVAIATGESHSCALTTAGGVKCWGDNKFGQLGDGTTANRSMPVDVLNLSSGVVAIAAGELYTCALTTLGGVKCWGDNHAGELGDGTTTDSDTPVNVSNLGSAVVAITAGEFHACALTAAGGVKCWGLNYYGQLGNGTTDDSSTPLDVSNLTRGAVAVAAGGPHTCALTTAGAIKCWGANFHGQLGDGTTSNHSTPVDVSHFISGGSAITLGESHSCALTTAGAVKCWGYNADGELGDGATSDSDTPVDVANLAGGIAAITAGRDHTCALTRGGGIKCWGYNDSGQLGDGTVTSRSTPVDVSDLSSGVAAITAGELDTCALTGAGGVSCWGNNQGNGELGYGITAIATGGGQTCALTAAGGVKCWGLNYYGQLGNGTTSGSSTAVDVSNLGRGVAAIAAGDRHTCALTAVGGVKCWGDNADGELGDGTTHDSSTPVNVSNLHFGVAAIAAGESDTCAVTATGGVKCWGDNYNGQLGDGTKTNSATPVDVSDLTTGVAAVVVGESHGCALTTAGGVKCWGNNTYDQLGDGTSLSSMKPVNVSNLSSGVVAIAAGDKHTCALTTAGGVKCWGDGFYGQLGNGMGASAIPVDVTNLTSNVVAIAAGHNHNCALTNSGEIKCWGYNAAGQLGNGSATNSATPVTVLASQSISFAPSRRMGVGESVALSATASGGGAVSFDTWTPDRCSVSGHTLTLIAPGLCGVRASQAGGSDGAGGSVAAAPQQRRVIEVETGLIFSNGFDATGGFSD